MLISFEHISHYYAMSESELYGKLAELINQHAKGNCGSIYQEPYKGDILVLFKALHFRKRKPRMFYEIKKRLRKQLIDNSKLEETLNKIEAMWNEWCYCWQYIGH